MSTKAEIFNLALTNVSAKGSVNDPNEDTFEANTCLENFDNALEVLLEESDWGFVSVSVALALTSPHLPETPWIYQYVYPSDCLKAREIVRETLVVPSGSFSSAQFQNPVFTENEIPFRLGINSARTGNVIHTDKREAILRYTVLIEKESLLPPKAVEALGWKLATRIAMKITGNEELKKFAEQGYLNSLVTAAALNFNESVNRKPSDPEAISSRF